MRFALLNESKVFRALTQQSFTLRNQRGAFCVKLLDSLLAFLNKTEMFRTFGKQFFALTVKIVNMRFALLNESKVFRALTQQSFTLRNQRGAFCVKLLDSLLAFLNKTEMFRAFGKKFFLGIIQLLDMRMKFFNIIFLRRFTVRRKDFTQKIQIQGVRQRRNRLIRCDSNIVPVIIDRSIRNYRMTIFTGGCGKERHCLRRAPGRFKQRNQIDPLICKSTVFEVLFNQADKLLPKKFCDMIGIHLLPFNRVILLIRRRHDQDPARNQNPTDLLKEFFLDLHRNMFDRFKRNNDIKRAVREGKFGNRSLQILQIVPAVRLTAESDGIF